MTPEQKEYLEKLLEALDHYGHELRTSCKGGRVIEAAAKFAEIYPDLCVFHEAGEKATGERWDHTLIDKVDFPEIFITNDDLYEEAVATVYCRSAADFITKAANLRPAIAKVVG